MFAWFSSGTVRALAVNESRKCVVLTTPSGFDVCRLDPPGSVHHTFRSGIRFAQEFFGTSIVAMSGSGDDPDFSPRRLELYDTERGEVAHSLSFEDTVFAVRFSVERLVVVLRSRVHIYDLNLQHLYQLETVANPCGLCSLAEAAASTLAVPGSVESGWVELFDAHGLHRLARVHAHEGTLSALALNTAGTCLATASSRGMLVRVFAVPSGDRIATFRRGSTPAAIYGLTFSPDSAFVAAASSSSTLHVFRVAEPRTDTQFAAPAPGAAGAASPAAPSPPAAAAAAGASTPDSGTQAGVAGAEGWAPTRLHQWAGQILASPEFASMQRTVRAGDLCGRPVRAWHTGPYSPSFPPPPPPCAWQVGDWVPSSVKEYLGEARSFAQVHLADPSVRYVCALRYSVAEAGSGLSARPPVPTRSRTRQCRRRAPCMRPDSASPPRNPQASC